MSLYAVQAFLAVTDSGILPLGITKPSLDGPTGPMGPWKITSLHKVGRPLMVETTSPEAACEALYVLANIGLEGGPVKGVRDDDAEAWLSVYRERDRARSMCVGDLAVINAEVAYQALDLGFAPITRAMAREVPSLMDDRWWLDVARGNAEASGART